MPPCLTGRRKERKISTNSLSLPHVKPGREGEGVGREKGRRKENSMVVGKRDDGLGVPLHGRGSVLPSHAGGVEAWPSSCISW